MKILPWTLLAIAVIALVLLWFREPTENKLSAEREKAYQTQQAITLAEKAKSDARAEYWKKKLVDTVKVVIVKSEAKDKEIRALRTRLAKTRTEVQPILDTIPTLKAFVEQQDSLIQSQDEQIIVLRDGLYQVGKDLTSLIGEQEVNARISADMLVACEQRHSDIMDLKNRELKKAKRSGRLAKVLIPVGAVAGFLLGSQL